MSITVVNANRVGGFLEFEICPNFEDECRCFKKKIKVLFSEVWTDTSEPLVPHKYVKFTAEPPTWVNAKGREVSFKDDWAEHCLNEALMLVGQENTQFSKQPLEHLVGRKF